MRRRTVLAGLALFFIAFAAYGSLVPLHFRHTTFNEALVRFRHADDIPLRSASRSDLVANVLLFVPIGFFLVGAVADRSRRTAVLALPFMIAVGGAISVAIEFSQEFVFDRTSSWNDIRAETLGAAIGGCLWLALGPRVIALVFGITRGATADDRAVRVLVIYAAAWVALGLLPLDFTLRPPELAEKYRAGRIRLTPAWRSRPLADVAATTAATALWAAPIGGLGALVARRRGLGSAAGVVGAVAIVAGTELGQVFVYSRTAAAGDVIAGGIGVVAGALIARRVTGGRDLRPAAHRPAAPFRRWALLLLGVWVVVLLFRHWAPFDFVVTGAMYEARARALWQVPFHSYYWAMPLAALEEAMRKALIAAPVGALLQLAWPRGSRRAAVLESAVLVSGSIVLFAVIELGQVFLPGRFPDVTDVLLGTAGSLLGAWVIRVVRMGGVRA